LMLHSFGLRFKPWTDYAQFIRSGITRRSQTPVDFHDHSLLNARLADDKADAPFVDYLHALYADKSPDLILAIGAPAANFVQRYRERIFPGTPMVFTGVEARRVQSDKLTRDDTVDASSRLSCLPMILAVSALFRIAPSGWFISCAITGSHLARGGETIDVRELHQVAIAGPKANRRDC
jgi:hypothetical protein